MQLFKRLFCNAKIISILILLISITSFSCVQTKDKTESCITSTSQTVICGADRLLSEYSHLIKGKKIALVTNHTGRLEDGTHLTDTLHNNPDTELIVLFGMHFNIRTNDYSLPKDEETDIDFETGLPKHSLYGKCHKPTNEMLKNVEVIIFDIQEVGARFYEHVNILGFVMEAAAENDIEVIVLDRPNPITGLRIDGFVTEKEFLFSFGSYGKIPVIHGLTMGELARLYNGEGMLRNGVHCKLHVIEMKGWKRSMWYDQTGLEWIKPSPNLPTPKSLLAYTGTCLFEGLNISTGRGTEKPFEYIGAPWIDNISVASQLNSLNLEGVVYDTITFIPTKMAFHSRPPLFSGESCKGIFVNITDRNIFEPYKTGIAMVWAFYKCHAKKLEWNEETIFRLTGTGKFHKMIGQGAHPKDIFASWEKELTEFKELYNSYLIY